MPAPVVVAARTHTHPRSMAPFVLFKGIKKPLREVTSGIFERFLSFVNGVKRMFVQLEASSSFEHLRYHQVFRGFLEEPKGERLILSGTLGPLLGKAGLLGIKS